MFRGRNGSTRTALVALLAAAIAGCSAVLGLGDYSISDTPADGGSPESAATDAPAATETGADTGGGGVEDASCDVDLKTTCYACTPTSTDEFLNSCSEGQCIPFDNGRLSGLLLPDGGLPPLPAPDGG